MKNKEKVKQGKKSRRDGGIFERKVRLDLEEKGWVISKWQNNVEFEKMDYPRNIPSVILDPKDSEGKKEKVREYLLNDGKIGKLIPAKHKFCGVGRPMAIGTGFPDFIAFRKYVCSICFAHGFRECSYDIIGVECKSNGYLDKEEKEKCEWLLNKRIFSEILIAKKGNKEIKYENFKDKYGDKI
jgi:hypothetical protein